jgi:hypothetical protein
MICNACGGSTCISCDVIWHPGVSCAEDKEKRAATMAARNLEEVAATKYLGKHSKLCPNCQVRGAKVTGCNHMTCNIFRIAGSALLITAKFDASVTPNTSPTASSTPETLKGEPRVFT